MSDILGGKSLEMKQFRQLSGDFRSGSTYITFPLTGLGSSFVAGSDPADPSLNGL
jgi:hypothetical protein